MSCALLLTARTSLKQNVCIYTRAIMQCMAIEVNNGNRAPTVVVYQELSHTSTGVLYYMVYKVYPSSKSASQAYKM